MKTGCLKEDRHRIAADVAADKPVAAVALQRLADAPVSRAMGTSGAEGLLALWDNTGKTPELFVIDRRKRRRCDSQNPPNGGSHKVGIEFACHRQCPVVLAVKGLDADFPRLLGGEDFDLLLEEREDLLDNQDLFGRSEVLFHICRRDGPCRPELEDAHPAFGPEQRDGLIAV